MGRCTPPDLGGRVATQPAHGPPTRHHPGSPHLLRRMFDLGRATLCPCLRRCGIDQGWRRGAQIGGAGGRGYQACFAKKFSGGGHAFFRNNY